MSNKETSSILPDNNIPTDPRTGLKLGHPSMGVEKFGNPPRGYSNDEIGLVFKAICKFTIDRQARPSSLGTVVTAMKIIENLTGQRVRFLSEQDVWFICRDHLRNRLGLIEWDRNDGDSGGGFWKQHGFRLTKQGLESGGVKYVDVGWVWEKTPEWA